MSEKGASLKPTGSSPKSDWDLIAALMNSLDLALVVLDPGNQIRLANSAAASLLGFRLKEAQAQDFEHVVKCRQLVEWLNRSIAKGSETAGCRLELEAEAGGHPRTVAVQWFGLRDEKSGRSLGCAIVLRKTEREGLSEAKRVEELRSDLRHEVLTPLTSLRGFAELMLSRKFSEEKKREFLQIIHDETVRVTALLDGLLRDGGRG